MEVRERQVPKCHLLRTSCQGQIFFFLPANRSTRHVAPMPPLQPLPEAAIDAHAGWGEGGRGEGCQDVQGCEQHLLDSEKKKRAKYQDFFNLKL